MDKIGMFIFLSVIMQVYLHHSSKREYNSFSVLINCSLPCSLMANSWLHLQLHKSLCPGKLGVLKKMTQDLRGEKKISLMKFSSMILNFLTPYLY